MCACALCFYLDLCKKDCKKSRNRKSGVGAWEFSPLTVNAKMLNKYSELILNVCIYVFNFGVAGTWEGVHFHTEVM